MDARKELQDVELEQVTGGEMNNLLLFLTTGLHNLQASSPMHVAMETMLEKVKDESKLGGVEGVKRYLSGLMQSDGDPLTKLAKEAFSKLG